MADVNGATSSLSELTIDSEEKQLHPVFSSQHRTSLDVVEPPILELTGDGVKDNVLRMVHALRVSEHNLVKQGVPKRSIVYIARNSPQSTLGSWWDTVEEAKEMFDDLGIDPHQFGQYTTYDCFAVDGRDPNNIKQALRASYKDGWMDDEKLLEYAESKK